MDIYTDTFLTYRYIGRVGMSCIRVVDDHLKLEVALHVLLEVDVGAERAVGRTQCEGDLLIALVELHLEWLGDTDGRFDGIGQLGMHCLVRVMHVLLKSLVDMWASLSFHILSVANHL